MTFEVPSTSTSYYDVKYDVKYNILDDIFFNADGMLFVDVTVRATVNVKIIKADGTEVRSFEKTIGVRKSIENIDIDASLNEVKDEVAKYINDIKQKIDKLNAIHDKFNKLISQQ